jgi:hypothetical protein
VTDAPRPDERTVARQIVSYFLRSPRAVDTLEGIARWRLLDEQIHQSVQMTDMALQLLEEMGLLIAKRAESAETLYRLNKSKRKEAEAFLHE